MKSDGNQLDVFRHSDAGMAQAYLHAAEAARRNPWECPEDAEKRARHYEAQARSYGAPA